MKTQELNYENIPVIEESVSQSEACIQLKRRVVRVRMGKATLTADSALVNEAEGIFQLIPQEELSSFLRQPYTATIYLRDWCLPFFKEHPVQECLSMLNRLGAIDASLANDTEWLEGRLSGAKGHHLERKPVRLKS